MKIPVLVLRIGVVLGGVSVALGASLFGWNVYHSLPAQIANAAVPVLLVLFFWRWDYPNEEGR